MFWDNKVLVATTGFIFFILKVSNLFYFTWQIFVSFLEPFLCGRGSTFGAL